MYGFLDRYMQMFGGQNDLMRMPNFQQPQMQNQQYQPQQQNFQAPQQQQRGMFNPNWAQPDGFGGQPMTGQPQTQPQQQFQQPSAPTINSINYRLPSMYGSQNPPTGYNTGGNPGYHGPGGGVMGGAPTGPWSQYTKDNPFGG